MLKVELFTSKLNVVVALFVIQTIGNLPNVCQWFLLLKRLALEVRFTTQLN